MLPSWEPNTKSKKYHEKTIEDEELELLYSKIKRPRMIGTNNIGSEQNFSYAPPPSLNMLKLTNEIESKTSSWKESISKILSRMSYQDLTIPFGNDIGSFISQVSSNGIDLNDIIIIKPAFQGSDHSSATNARPRLTGAMFFDDDEILSDTEEKPSPNPRPSGTKFTNDQSSITQTNIVVNIHDLTEFLKTSRFESPYIMSQLKPGFVSAIRKSQVDISKQIMVSNIDRLFILDNPLTKTNRYESDVFIMMIKTFINEKQVTDFLIKSCKNISPGFCSFDKEMIQDLSLLFVNDSFIRVLKNGMETIASQESKSFERVWFTGGVFTQPDMIDKFQKIIFNSFTDNLSDSYSKLLSTIVTYLQYSLTKEGVIHNIFSLGHDSVHFEVFKKHLKSSFVMLYNSIMIGSPYLAGTFHNLQIEILEPMKAYTAFEYKDNVDIQDGASIDLKDIFKYNSENREKDHQNIEERIIESIIKDKKNYYFGTEDITIAAFRFDVQNRKHLKTILRYSLHIDAIMMSDSPPVVEKKKSIIEQVGGAVSTFLSLSSSSKAKIQKMIDDGNSAEPDKFPDSVWGPTELNDKKIKNFESFRYDSIWISAHKQFKIYNFIGFIEELNHRCLKMIPGEADMVNVMSSGKQIISTRCHNLMIVYGYIKRLRETMNTENIFDIFYKYDYRTQFVKKPLEYMKKNIDNLDTPEGLNEFWKYATLIASLVPAVYGNGYSTLKDAYNTLNSTTVKDTNNVMAKIPFPGLSSTGMNFSKGGSQVETDSDRRNYESTTKSQRNYGELIKTLRDFMNSSRQTDDKKSASKEAIKSKLIQEISDIERYEAFYTYRKDAFEFSYDYDEIACNGVFSAYVKQILDDLVKKLKDSIFRLKMNTIKQVLHTLVPEADSLFDFSILEDKEASIEYRPYIYDNDITLIDKKLFPTMTKEKINQWKEKISTSHAVPYILKISEDLGRHENVFRAWKEELGSIPVDDIVTNYGVSFLVFDELMKHKLSIVLQGYNFLPERKSAHFAQNTDYSGRILMREEESEYSDPYEDILSMVNELWTTAYSFCRINLGIFMIQNFKDGIHEMKINTSDMNLYTRLTDNQIQPIFLKDFSLRSDFSKYVALLMQETNLNDVGMNRIQGRGDHLRRVKLEKCRTLHSIRNQLSS